MCSCVLGSKPDSKIKNTESRWAFDNAATKRDASSTQPKLTRISRSGLSSFVQKCSDLLSDTVSYYKNHRKTMLHMTVSSSIYHQ